MALMTDLTIWRNRDFLVLLLVQCTDAVSRGMFQVLITYCLLIQGYGIEGVAVVLSADAAAMTVLLLIGGVAADRLDARRIIAVSAAITTVALGMLAWLLQTGHPSLWVISILGAASGGGRAFHAPTTAGMMMRLASGGDTHRMSAASGIGSAAGGMLGPALSGLLIAAVGVSALATCAALSVISMLASLLLKHSGSPVMSDMLGKVEHQGFWIMVREGFREFLSHDWIWAFTAQFALLQVLAFSPFYLAGPLLIGTDGAGARDWGLILAAEGVGALLGGAIIYRVRPSRPMLWSVCCAFPMATPMFALGGGASVSVCMMAMVLCGIGIAACNALWNTSLRTYVAEEALARVKSLEFLVSNCTAPIGYILAGPMISAIGAEKTMLLGAGVIVSSTCLVLLLRSVRTLRAIPA